MTIQANDPDAIYDVKGFDELEADYKAFVGQSCADALDLGDWLPSFRSIRPLVPGELCTIQAETGIGKSLALQNISVKCSVDPAIFFEMELPGTLMFERYQAYASRITCKDVESAYQGHGMYASSGMPWSHIYVHDRSQITVDHMERVIDRARTVRNLRVMHVYVDYIGLMSAKGKSRYERMTDAAQAMKVLAKNAGVVVVCATQIGRLADGEEMSIHSARDSGAIEESAGMLLGMWRDKDDPRTQWIKVLKSTKGGSGLTIECNFDGARMSMTEKATNLDPSANEIGEGDEL